MREQVLAMTDRPQFTVETKFTDSTAVVTVSGDADVVTASMLAEMLALTLEKQPANLVLDLGGVMFLDCAAARVIFYAAQSRSAGCRFRICRARAVVRRLLYLTGLDALIEVEPTGVSNGPQASSGGVGPAVLGATRSSPHDTVAPTT